jgi:hypothetical protein
MRLVTLTLAALTAVVAAAGPAAAAWKEHEFKDLGIAKEFPGDPKREAIEFKTPVAGTAKATLLSITEENVAYRLTVVELQNKVEVGASIMGECVHMAEAEGEPLANMTTRIEPGAAAVYGRLVSVNLKDNKGRRQTACFYTKGRLYKIDATVLPENGQPNSSQAIRFTNSMRFNLDHKYGEGEAEAEAGG